MVYNPDLTWADLVRKLSQKGRNLMIAIRESRAEYNEWQSFRAGRSNGQIATALGRDATEIADIDAAFGAFLHIENYLTNNTPTSGLDHAFSLRKFT